MTLGEKVHMLRRRRDLTQRELGKLAAVHHNYLARLERDEIADPGSKMIMRLARVLEVSTDYLLGMDETEEADLLAAVAV